MKNTNRYKDEDRTGSIYTVPPYQFHGYSVFLLPGVQGVGRVNIWWDKEADIEIRPSSKNTFYCIVEGKALTAAGVPRRFFSVEEAIMSLSAAA